MKYKNKIIIAIGIIIFLIIIYITSILFIKKPNEDGNIITNFFPSVLDFIQDSDINIPLITNQSNNQELEESLLYQIPNHISADFVFNTSSSTITTSATSSLERTSNFIVSVEKTTGHLYFYDLDKKIMTRLSNTTISGVDSIYNSYDKDKLYVYLSTPSVTNKQYYSYNFNPEAIESRVTNVIKINPFINIIGGINNLLYWKNIDTNFIYKGNANLSNAETILTNSKIDWSYNYTNTELTTTQKPSSILLTSSYVVKNGGLEKTLSNKRGLNIKPSPDGQWVLYSTSNQTSVNTYLYNLKSNQGSILNIKTLADKCAWSRDSSLLYCAAPKSIPNGNYPDDWYSGLVNFEDNIFVILPNKSTSATNINTDIPRLDVEKIEVGSNDVDLIIKNKTDNTLWVKKFIY